MFITGQTTKWRQHLKLIHIMWPALANYKTSNMDKCLPLHVAVINSTGNLWSVLITWKSIFSSMCQDITEPLKFMHYFIFLLLILIPATIQVKWDTYTLWLVPWFTRAGHIPLNSNPWDTATWTFTSDPSNVILYIQQSDRMQVQLTD